MKHTGLDNINKPAFDAAMKEIKYRELKVVTITNASTPLTEEQIKLIKGDNCIITYGNLTLYKRLTGQEHIYYMAPVSNASTQLTTTQIDITLATGAITVTNSNVDKVSANLSLAGTEAQLTSLKVGNTKYKVGLTIGDVTNLGQMIVENLDPWAAYFSKTITNEEFDALPSQGLLLLMFNGTSVLVPFAKTAQQPTLIEQLFVISAAYNTSGATMVVRARLEVSKTAHWLRIYFDEVFAEHANDFATKPYGVIRIVSL